MRLDREHVSAIHLHSSLKMLLNENGFYAVKKLRIHVICVVLNKILMIIETSFSV